MSNKESASEVEKLVGEVVHYYSKIGVAVVELCDSLRRGDNVRIVGGVDTDFTQEIKSIEVDHEKIEVAKKGDSVGLKVGQKVREGYKVYKI